MVDQEKSSFPKEDNILLEWVASSRPFKKRSSEFYRTVAAIAFLFVVIFFFAREIMAIITILAVLFVVYALSTVPPEQIKNKITTLGIQTDQYFHKWEEMYEFWFDEKYGQKMLVVRLLMGFPTHLQLLLGDKNPVEIKKILADKLPYREKPERTFLDNAANWLSSKIPLERVS